MAYNQVRSLAKPKRKKAKKRKTKNRKEENNI